MLPSPTRPLKRRLRWVLVRNRDVERAEDLFAVHRPPKRRHDPVGVTIAKVEVEGEVAERQIHRSRDCDEAVTTLDFCPRHRPRQLDIRVGDVAPPARGEVGIDYSTTLQNAPTVVRLGRIEMPTASPLLML